MGNELGYLSELTKAVSNVFRLGLDLLGTRLELMALELQEEKRRLVGLMIGTALAVLFATLALVMFTFTVVYMLEGQSRIIALTAFTMFYFLSALIAVLVLRHKLLSARPFSQTLKEFRKDRECF